MFAQVFPIAREAYRRLFADRRLWLFGFFVGAGAGGVSLDLSGSGASSIPGWVFGLAAVAILLGLVIFGLHVVSEGALIEAVRRERDGERVSLGRAWKSGARSGWRVLGVKAVTWLVAAAAVVVAAAPALAGALGGIDLALGAVLTAMLAILAAPVLVTLYLVHEIAMRMVVLERRGVIDAIGGAQRFLRGRLRYGLGLLLVDGLAQAAAGLVSVPFALVALGVGFGVYALAGLVPGVVVGALLVLPVALMVVGARGTFRSRLWTVAFLEERPTLGSPTAG